MSSFIHQNLASGGWQKLSLIEQMANIGSEVSRAQKWLGRDQRFYERAVQRALELFDLTLADSRWKKRLREIARTREVFCDTITGGTHYRTSLEDLEHYFFPYAFAARHHKYE